MLLCLDFSNSLCSFFDLGDLGWDLIGLGKVRGNIGAGSILVCVLTFLFLIFGYCLGVCTLYVLIVRCCLCLL